MEVRVEPNTVKREEYGAIVGKVATVSDFPVTPQGMLAGLHNDALVKRFSQDGAPYAAKMTLERDPSTVSGYRWTSGKGRPFASSLSIGMRDGRWHMATRLRSPRRFSDGRQA